MNKSFLYLIVLSALFSACDKDKLNTKPTIKLKSVSSDVVPNEGSLLINIEFADKEGDISNNIFVQKIRTNTIATPTIRDSFNLTIAEFPKKSRGDIELNLRYQDHLISAINPGTPPNVRNDTLIFRLALTDQANNTSDTISTEPIVILR